MSEKQQAIDTLRLQVKQTESKISSISSHSSKLSTQIPPQIFTPSPLFPNISTKKLLSALTHRTAANTEKISTTSSDIQTLKKKIYAAKVQRMEYLKQQKIATELYSKFDFLGFNVEDTKEFERLERAERLLGDARRFLLREVSKIFRISTPSSSANHHASVSSSSATNPFKRNYYLQQQQQLLHYSTILGLKFSLISYPTRILRDEFNTAISSMVKVLNIVSLYTDIKLLNSIDWKGDKLLIEVSRTVDFGDGLSNDDNKSNSSKSGSGKTKRNKSMSLPLYLTDSNIPQFHRAISLLVYNILYVSFETGIDVSLQSCLEPLECLRQICIGNWGNERNFLMEEDKLADASAETNNRIFDISLKKVVRVLDRAREFTGEVDEFVIGDEGEDSDVVEIEEDGSEDADEWLVI